jgi:hypothetical protein
MMTLRNADSWMMDIPQAHPQNIFSVVGPMASESSVATAGSFIIDRILTNCLRYKTWDHGQLPPTHRRVDVFDRYLIQALLGTCCCVNIMQEACAAERE